LKGFDNFRGINFIKLGRVPLIYIPEQYKLIYIPTILLNIILFSHRNELVIILLQSITIISKFVRSIFIY
jgi:hypothetical protein